jgi:4-diphosphocytidyl-2-C-methyl-D-erythritol kinase
VLGRRDDGYHEIATVMQAVDLSDRLALEASDALEVHAPAAGVPTDTTNLAMRAALAFRDATGLELGVRIVLDKRIPVAAGLGGGSADAAAVLVGLNQLWRVRWPRARLEEVAVSIGMDVPFFLRGGCCLATGRGEHPAPVPSGSLAMVLVNPGLPSSTAEAYRRVTAASYTDGRHTRSMVAALRSGRPTRVAESLYNGLEAAAPCYPQIVTMKAALLAAGALGVAMSGSGPTVFGIARSYDHARQLRARVARVSWACWAVRGLRGPAVRVRATDR